jgi:hypothetical protein
MIYYIKALILVVRGARYHRYASLSLTLRVIATRNCRLHWLRASLGEG